MSAPYSMDPTTAAVPEPNQRPQRERRLPDYLGDFEVGYTPQLSKPKSASYRSSSQQQLASVPSNNTISLSLPQVTVPLQYVPPPVSTIGLSVPVGRSSHSFTPAPAPAAVIATQPRVVQQPSPVTQAAPMLSQPPPMPAYQMPLLPPLVSALPQLHPAAPQPSSVQPLSADLLIASAYGIPRPALPFFESGRESDFALLKMALDNLLSTHAHLSEQYKYQVLLGQLKHANALQLAKAYMYHPQPYTSALQALQDKYGQPRQLVQSELGAILSMSAFKPGDANAFDAFALAVQSLVGMLRTLEGQNGYELMCGSHVDRLLSKMPPNLRDSFVEYCLNRSILQTGTDRTYTLPDLAEWLQIKSQAKRISSRAASLFTPEPYKPFKANRSATMKDKSTPVLLTLNEKPSPSTSVPSKSTSKPKPYCPCCDNRDHYLNSCNEFKKLSTNEIVQWIKDGKRCWKCGRNHSADACTLKRPCKVCKEIHLTSLHDSVQATSGAVLMVNVPPTQIYFDRPNRSQRVMLKIVSVLVHNGDQAMEVHAILDDGSERTVILPQVVQQLNLKGNPETLALRTVHQSIQHLAGSSVSFDISPLEEPAKRYHIRDAFTAQDLSLAEVSYPVQALQQRYQHLRGLPLRPLNHVQPLILIGSDAPHLLTPVQPTRKGPEGGPIAVCTLLGWTLQGPMSPFQSLHREQQCLHLAKVEDHQELIRNVERLWQLDVLPQSEKVYTRSKEDQQAFDLLQSATTRVDVQGVHRYATPLLRRTPVVKLHAPKEAVLPNLRNTERRLAKEPKRAESYCAEIRKLEEAGYVARITPQEADQSEESWFIPHHMVHHNRKDRIVFNCSFQYQGQSLNDQLLPGPTLGPSLLGVLLRFRQHSIAVSGDIKGMFHQVRLLPSDRPLLRFLWRDLKRDEEPSIFEWQVLPFGTTCSPCCAIYALQHHLNGNSTKVPSALKTIEQSFYVDNCLHSTPTSDEARSLVDSLRQLLSEGGFELRQWASNLPAVIEHLPSEARSTASELWLSKGSSDLQELTLGMEWNCLTDNLGYKQRSTEPLPPTLRNLYKKLASQYDPLGFMIPFTTRAKILIQDLWRQELGWDDPIEPDHLREEWDSWEQELSYVPHLHLPRPYAPTCADSDTSTRELHVFSDASERAYGAVAYIRTIDKDGDIHTAFVMAKSRVAPRKKLSIPRLELSAALTGAQVAKVILTELTIPINKVFMWSDSTTVLQWLQSESCRYKVFVGTRVAEIQSLTDVANWRYVDTTQNPADDLTRGLSLAALTRPHRWSSGPAFLLEQPDLWPMTPVALEEPDMCEFKKSTLIGAINVSTQIPDAAQFQSWQDLVQATIRVCDGAADSGKQYNATDVIKAEKAILAQSQLESFPDEVKALKAKRKIPVDSRLASLAPEYDEVTGLVRVGGRLRRAEDLDMEAIHPIILDPAHRVTRLLIQKFDQQLLHPGPERVLAEMRRQYWVLRGREAIRKLQHSCRDCQHWRAKPNIPKMADLPLSRLRLYKPPFYSAGVDCFGPFSVQVGRRQEKRWGILYKCMTTRCVHLDLLESLDSDAFLLSLRRFIARRGQPYEVLCDNGTNFVGANRELQEAFERMLPELQEQLANQRIRFSFNPPSAPHFGGTWEREVKSVKTALKVILKEQSVPEPVLYTLLVEIEGILNAKPLGYVSSDIADPDPITPNILLMGRRDSSLPQVFYDQHNLLGRRRWRHSQILADNFWAAFIRNYLPGLQERQKWRTETKELDTGQVVLIVDPQLPRALWPVGSVTETFRGADGRVRTASIKVKDKMYIRPVARLIPLPKITEEEDTPASLSQ